ncbi:DUF1190 domain-containing protein [Phenylobacterium sp. SCN 70-31]|uniref:DUF1190 domain-containing protein n=1 Tax=Phenylobacterium sp. SCN 70-31 TaxID=1660129 RepID=UPI00086A6316|nr:DUF1190 domain-containing protein [Phenylobacterium sp. SCN 70-31]ODT89332.1 MAG: hypothetical protein ABS78_03875 [Phenylobacterium sp. SCN 70-31]
MKRSRTLTLTTLMAAGGVSLTACGDNATPTVRIENPGASVDAYAYRTLQECKDRDEVPDAACEAAETAALEDQDKAPRYAAQGACEEVYGAGQCVPRSEANGGGSFWGPLVAGFVVGRMLDGGWGGRGLYRDWRDGGFYTGSGGRVWTDYTTGRTRIGTRGFDPPDAYQPPAKVQSRAGVISRGGFGGNMSSRSYSGSRWGG